MWDNAKTARIVFLAFVVVGLFTIFALHEQEKGVSLIVGMYFFCGLGAAFTTDTRSEEEAKKGWVKTIFRIVFWLFVI
jgi:hypothetical protein